MGIFTESESGSHLADCNLEIIDIGFRHNRRMGRSLDHLKAHITKIASQFVASNFKLQRDSRRYRGTRGEHGRITRLPVTSEGVVKVGACMLR